MEVINQHFREAESIAVPQAEGLNSEFLNALPYAIREELIRQERLEEGQRNHDREPTAPLVSARTVVPPHQNPIASSKGSTRESMAVVDSAGVASLLRLVFAPRLFDKQLLFQLLGNLCENSKARGELIGLLLSILSNGSVDLASVDKTFSLLSLKNRMKPLANEEENFSVSSLYAVPNLVAQQCLEVLTTLTESNSSVGKYFLTESELPAFVKTPRKKKGKTVNSQFVYPVVILLNLLDQPIFLSNGAVLEQLMHLLSNILRPLSHIAKKKFSQIDSKPSNENDDVVLDVVKESGSSELINAKEKNEIKLPVIPDSSISNAVKVLVEGSSSSKSFQFTLSVIQYLCSYPYNLNIVIHDLLSFAQSISESVMEEIQGLLDYLQSLDSQQSLPPSMLEYFTSQSASQAKMLRVLKTVDYLFSKTNGT